MGSEETQYYIYHDMYSRSEIVALSAWPLGVNKLCVCVPPTPDNAVPDPDAFYDTSIW